MKKYGGTLIHQAHDDFGVVEVVENRIERSLHFGTEAKQSAMDLREPLRLVLSYTRAMSAALLFTPRPRRILLLGLGGGSLVKFLLHRLPECRIDAVELRPAVHQVAGEFFRLPRDPRLHVHIGEADGFVRRLGPGGNGYDLVLVDAFSAEGVAESVCTTAFADACRLCLSKTGTLAINLWSGDAVNAADVLRTLDDLLGPLLELPVEGRDNIIGLAGPAVMPACELRRLGPLARTLEREFDVEYPQLLKRLRKANRRMFSM